ncbi:siderophore-interacting protein [Paracoccus rhizosphaerae]|uniref:Siderophore-interacting protein n=1 Tax=Paracoccus rhizosphaerae TaxID=1133347 RepID=A0ABV6CLF5_9RHOB|nr:siderophore-interacting protein [Paracoccus rhizosphaerae]
MSHLRNFRAAGTIPKSSGTAAAALKARASAWEVPVVEDPDSMSMHLWGGELRLTRQTDGLRIDLLAPEERLVGALRETATELFGEVGLTVRWDHVDVGALAPGLSLMRVADVAHRSPNFLRVRLTGSEAARFGTGSLHFRLLLPPRGRTPIWPRVAETGRTVWPEGQDAMHRPVYTVAAHRADWIDFDIFRHADSPTCMWAEGGPIGQEVGVLGPGGGWCPDARRLWLFGDETALPAIARMLDLTRAPVQAVLRSAAGDLGPLAENPAVRRCDDLIAALEAVEDFDGGQVWFAASTAEAREARTLLLRRGLPKTQFTAAGYWAGRVE